MKLSFSTLGCPDWTWSRIVEQASKLGFQGIEVRGIEGEMHLPQARPFLPNKINETRRELDDLGLVICCLGTSSRFDHPDKIGESLTATQEHIDLAHELGTPFIRVFGDRVAQEERRQEVVESIAQALNSLGEYAAGSGVTVLLETHGDFSRSSDLLQIMNRVEQDNVGVLWDVHHPYRFFGENPAETFARLKPFIRHTHFKDSRRTADGFRYCLLGEGDTPVGQFVKLLKEWGYDGFYSLEWEKKWHPEIEEPEVAFAQYVPAMRALYEQV